MSSEADAIVSSVKDNPDTTTFTVTRDHKEVLGGIINVGGRYDFVPITPTTPITDEEQGHIDDAIKRLNEGV